MSTVLTQQRELLAHALRYARAMLGERQISFHDVVTWATSENILPDKSTWLELRSLRNRLTHAYDPASDALSELVKLICQSCIELAAIIERFNRVCARRSLIPA